MSSSSEATRDRAREDERSDSRSKRRPRTGEANQGAGKREGVLAGADSPHLEEDERAQAAEHAAPHALVIHELIREEGEKELQRSVGAVAWSGLAAGLSMGFSFLCMALIQSALPEAPWRHLIASAGYTVGFVIVILARQALYTESTLSAVLPLLHRGDAKTLLALLRFWAVVLAANIVGAAMFGMLLLQEGLFSAEVGRSLQSIAAHAMSGSFGITLLKAVLAGWLIALMAWMLPSARSAKLFVILLFTYVVALGQLSHIIAGSVEAAYALLGGQVSAWQVASGFLLPTLLGNTIGGVALVAMLNRAPLAEELERPARKPAPAHQRPYADIER